MLGKAGRADTSTDPAPLSMLETVDHAQAARGVAARADLVLRLGAGVAEAASSGTSRSDRISTEELVNQLNEALQLPGVSNAWTMPIKARIDMLTTGIRTPVGLKISGADLRTIEDIGDADRGPPAVGARDAQRVRGADGRGLLPRRRVEPRRAGPLRPQHGRGADRGAERHRRRERHDDGRGAGALPGERPLHARFPHRLRRPRPRARPGLRRRAPDPARPAGRDQGRHRAGHDPERGRPADRLRLRGRRRPRSGRLHAGGGPAHPGQGEAARGIRGAVERPVRGDGAGARSARLRHPPHRCSSSCSCST